MTREQAEKQNDCDAEVTHDLKEKDNGRRHFSGKHYLALAG